MSNKSAGPSILSKNPGISFAEYLATNSNLAVIGLYKFIAFCFIALMYSSVAFFSVDFSCNRKNNQHKRKIHQNFTKRNYLHCVPNELSFRDRPELSTVFVC